MPENEKRYRTTYHGYKIEELTEGGGCKPFFEEAGCVWDDAPAPVHLALQEAEAKMREGLRQLGVQEYEKKRGRKGQ